METEVKPVVEKPKTNEVLVVYDNNGVAEFSNQKELSSLAQLYMKTKQVPQNLMTEGLEAVMAAVSLCRNLSIPDTCISSMAYIHGKITCYGELVTAVAERHPEYGERRDFFITEEGEEICSKNKNLKTGKPYAAVVQIKKRHGTVWNEYTFSVDDAIKANLLNEQLQSTKSNWKDATWTKYMKDMMWHKANARAMKANYASALKGVNYYEDVKEVFDKIRDVTDPTTTNSVNEFFKTGESHQQGVENGNTDNHAN